MRGPARLAVLGALLTASVPFVPMARNAVFIGLSGDRERWTCSLVGIARESFGEATPPDRRSGGCGLRFVSELMDEPGRLDGRIECAAFFVLAVLAAWAAIPRWTRHAWVVGVVIAGVAGWTWWALRSDLVVILKQLPGGTAVLPAWMRPWPFVLAGWATLSLAIASLSERRSARRARAAAARVPRIFE